MTLCKHVYYSGNVQGVGFRYTAQSLAESFSVTGYVRNLPGGDVELLVEGSTDQVEAFLAALAQRMERCIERTRIQDETPGGFKDFSIKH